MAPCVVCWISQGVTLTVHVNIPTHENVNELVVGSLVQYMEKVTVITFVG